MRASFILLAMLLAGATVAFERTRNAERFENRPPLLAGRFDDELPLRFEIQAGQPRTPSRLWVRFVECRFILQFSRHHVDGRELLWLQIATESNPHDKAEIFAEQEMSGEIDRESVTFRDYHKNAWSFSCETLKGPVDYEVRGYEISSGFTFEPLDRYEKPLNEGDWEVATSESCSPTTKAATSTICHLLFTTLFSATLISA